MNPTTESIYIIKETGTNYIKIGVTGDVAKRLIGLQTGNPRQLKVIASWEGDRHDEIALHQLLADYEECGEWFNPPTSVLSELVARSTAKIAPPRKLRLVGFKRSRRKAGILIRRVAGYSLAESEYGVQYLRIVGRHPDRTSADKSVWPLAGYFNWKSLEASGLLRKERKTR